MPSDEGHRDSWSAPQSGWPTFGPDGKIVKDTQPPRRRCPEKGPQS